MAPLPGWNAPRRTSRWAARGAWATAGIFALIVVASLLVRQTPLAEFVEPTGEGFPVDGQEPPDQPIHPQIEWAERNETFEDPTLEGGGVGSGRHTAPEPIG